VASRIDLPEGEVTFLFTDVQGSTQLLEEHPAEYPAKIARHLELLATAVADRRGVVFETVGDAVYAAFADPTDGVEAAIAGQLALAAEEWGALGALTVRMGLHTGPVERREAHYFGAALYRCARLMATAHGGQIVLTEVTAGLVDESIDATLVDLGLHQLKDMKEPERVFQVAGDGLEVDFPPLRSAGGRPNNLPAEVKTFVGRRQELDGLCELLVQPDVRAVTVTGTGGTGKTRLVLRVAKALLDPFRDGVFFVPLTPLASPELVMPAVAGVLNVQRSADLTLVDSIVTHLGGKELLLVLDNFEHVLAAAEDVAAILAAAPNVRVLVTSRAPLQIQGEHEVHVQPLPLPRPETTVDDAWRSPAVQLFVQRAQAARDDFALTDDNCSTVIEICRRLDGLPLAIELAAARSRLLSPEAMLERLDDRLGLLTGGPSDLPARQQTLRDAIAWSFDLLDEPEQLLLGQLAVFRGGCDLAAAEVVCDGDVLASLTKLVEHSLVETRWSLTGDTRYELLETIAEFARELLASSESADDVAERHARYFADYAESVEPSLYTDARAPWLSRLADDRDNFRAALAWSVDRDEASVGLRILAALWLWWWTSFSEGLEWAERVLGLASAAEPTSIRAGALFTAEICAAGEGDMEVIRRYAEQAVALSRELDDGRRLALAQGLGAGALAGWTQATGGPEVAEGNGATRAHELSTDAIAVAERTGDPWITAWVKMISALVALLAGNPAAAYPWASEAVEEFEGLGDSWSRASASVSLAFSLLQLGELDAARAALDGSADALLEVGDLKMAGGCRIALGLISRFEGNVEESEGHYTDALELCVRTGDPANAPVCLEGVAATLAAADPERAARLLGAAKALFDTGVQPSVPGFEVFYPGTRSMLADALGEDEVGRLEALGATNAKTRPLAELIGA
jgi:predicted ATPase/class 3 adenylate cyclase